jgi:hypothetical protein
MNPVHMDRYLTVSLTVWRIEPMNTILWDLTSNSETSEKLFIHLNLNAEVKNVWATTSISGT